MTAFDPKDARTWPLSLSLEQMAAIYERSADSIQHSFTPKARHAAFTPAPYQKHPMRWRKAAVVRHLRADDPVLLERAS